MFDWLTKEETSGVIILYLPYLRVELFIKTRISYVNNMCGGFTCSKNALIALNILYIVSTVLVPFWQLLIWLLLCLSVSGVRFDWSCSLWKSGECCHEFTDNRGDFSMRCAVDFNIDARARRSRKTSPSHAVFRIL